MSKTTNKAKVIECYDSVGCDRYWTVVELYDNGCISPYCIGEGKMFFKFSKENIDSLVKYAMDLGYTEVLLDDKVKKQVGLWEEERKTEDEDGNEVEITMGEIEDRCIDEFKEGEFDGPDDIEAEEE